MQISRPTRAQHCLAHRTDKVKEKLFSEKFITCACVPVLHEELLDYLPGDEVLDVDGELVGQLVGHQGHPPQRNDSSQVLLSLLWVQIALRRN